MIKINVGGKVYQTTENTLRFSPYFNALLNETYDNTKDENGNIFIDRDPKLFKYILSFLRNNNKKNLIDICIKKNELAEEIDFFGLDINIISKNFEINDGNKKSIIFNHIIKNCHNNNPLPNHIYIKEFYKYELIDYIRKKFTIVISIIYYKNFDVYEFMFPYVNYQIGKNIFLNVLHSKKCDNSKKLILSRAGDFLTNIIIRGFNINDNNSNKIILHIGNIKQEGSFIKNFIYFDIGYIPLSFYYDIYIEYEFENYDEKYIDYTISFIPNIELREETLNEIKNMCDLNFKYNNYEIIPHFK